MKDKPLLDIDRLQPAPSMRTIEDMVESDMLRYLDPDTGLLKSDLAEPVNNCYCCNKPACESEYLFNKQAFTYFQCSSCSHVFVNPRLNDSETNYLYNQGRCLYQLLNFYLPSAPYRQQTIYTRKLDEIERLTKPGTLLDFGCSTGYFLDTALKRGWKVYGVELNKRAVEWARNKLQLINIHDSDINACPFSNEMFDVITLWDVLEHLSKPFEILTTLHKLLKNNGLLVIETSKFDCFETDVLGSENTNIVGDMHLMHFTNKSLEVLVNRAGYSVVKIESFGLDLKHIHDYEKKKNPASLIGFERMRDLLQTYIDKSGRGCYMKCICKKR